MKPRDCVQSATENSSKTGGLQNIQELSVPLWVVGTLKALGYLAPSFPAGNESCFKTGRTRSRSTEPNKSACRGRRRWIGNPPRLGPARCLSSPAAGSVAEDAAAAIDFATEIAVAAAPAAAVETAAEIAAEIAVAFEVVIASAASAAFAAFASAASAFAAFAAFDPGAALAGLG